MKPEVIKALRKEARMTQQKLADTLCLSKSAVSKWEQGINQPKPDIEMMIANLFGVTLDYLNGQSSFSRFEKVMNQEFIHGVTFMDVFDQIISLPEAYRELIKLQLDGINALEREHQKERQRKTTGNTK